ncbi:MAG TPA: sulfotransferase domain-containing protein [Gemmatimonadota bacterium]|nr:sulfotransferase domain-containing protein [Gemmatimonadota bacterium]
MIKHSDDIPAEPVAAGLRVPDFFLVGAARSGTTSLFHYLVQHPCLCMPVKEPQFFSDFPLDHPKDLDGYLELFAKCPHGIVAGEASTWYLPSRQAPRRIHALNRRAKIAMILRNPIDRAYSHYWLKVRIFAEPLSFEAALEAEDQRTRDGWNVGFQYVATGLYSEQILRYLETFGEEQVRIVLFEDLIRDANAVCRDFFRFLGVDPGVPIRTTDIFNASEVYRSRRLARTLSRPFPGRRLIKRMLPKDVKELKSHLSRANALRPRPMNPDTRTRLAERFKPDIERLQGILNRDLSHWLTDSHPR